MIRGVIIWYSRLEYKALIWCEDSGGLAIAAGATSWRNPMVEISVGDYVGFEAAPCGRERKCRDIHLIAAQIAPSLPDSIRNPDQTAPKPVLDGNRLLHLCYSRD